MENVPKILSDIVAYLALALASMAAVLIRRHGKKCKEIQDDFVPRHEFNSTTQSLRGDITRTSESLRNEIIEGYRHIENRIDVGNGETHKRIDRMLERRDTNGR